MAIALPRASTGRTSLTMVFADRASRENWVRKVAQIYLEKKGEEKRENGSMWWTTEPNPILLDVRSAQDKGKVARDAFTPIYR